MTVLDPNSDPATFVRLTVAAIDEPCNEFEERIHAHFSALGSISNGGLEHLIETHADIRDFIVFHYEIGVKDAAKLLEQLIALFPDGVAPAKMDHRERWLSRHRKLLDRIEKPYFDLMDDVWSKFARFIAERQ